MSVDVALRSLAPYQTGGWIFTENTGYYVHRGRVYLEGEINAWGQGGITAAILTGLPAAIRPSTDQAFTLYADIGETEDTVDPALQLPLAYAATLRADGTLSLDAPPPAAATATPPGTYVDALGTHPRYTSPFLLGIALASVSWQIAADTDTYTPVSFAPYLGPDFTNIDATIVAHDVRAHLDGHVTATVDGAYRLATSLPADCVPAGPDADGQYGVIVAHDPRYHRVGELTTHSITFTNDPPPNLPPHHWGDPLTFPGLFNGDLGDRPAGSSGYSNIFQVGTAPQNGNDHWGPGDDYSCPVFDEGCGLVGTISCKIADGSGGGTGNFRGSATGSIAALVANYDPPPDWIAISVELDAGALGGFHGCRPCKDPDTGQYIGGGCAPDPGGLEIGITAPGPIVDGIGNVVDSLVDVSGLSGGGGASIQGSVARPTLAYTDAPADPRSILLWRADEIASIPFFWGGIATGGSAEWAVGITPFWERRKVYFKAGDVLDLSGAGWQLGFAPHAVSTIAAGARDTGAIRVRPPLAGRGRGALTRAGVVSASGLASTLAAGVQATGSIGHREDP